MRASDVDRKAVQDRLNHAHEEGRLDLTEFDARVGRAWKAKTRGDLAEIVADLPYPAGDRARRSGANVAMRVLTAIWLSASVVNLVIWVLVGLLGPEFVHPWFLWVALPPGSVLGVLWVLGVGRPGHNGS
jgi:hypothetical protein